MSAYLEENYENSIIELFQNDLGYDYVYGPSVERDFTSPLYEEVLLDSLYRINKSLAKEAIDEAIHKVKNYELGDLVSKNETFMDYLQNGVPVKYFDGDEERSTIVYLIDYDDIHNNSFIISNQWTFDENSTKRPDIIIFINGLPLVLAELKSPSREETDASEAFRQIRNYMQEIPSMFIYNAICVMSDQSTSKGAPSLRVRTVLWSGRRRTALTRTLNLLNLILFLKVFLKRKDFLILLRILYVFLMKG